MAKKFYVDGLTVDQILNMDPAQMAKLDKRDISRALRTVALAANKRIEKLEKYAKKTNTGYVAKTNAKKFISTDALNWVSSDGKRKARFGVKKSDNRNQMIAQIGRVRQFMAMKTSTVTGAVNVRKSREKSLFGKTTEQATRGKSKTQKAKIKKERLEMSKNIWSSYHKFRELKGQDPHAYYEGSDMVIQLLGQAITSGKSDEEALQNTLKYMTERYEEEQKSFEDLFGDDFTDFGNFNV